MIVWNCATLAIYSDTRTAAEVTEILGVEPHESAEKGDPTRAALAGRQVKPEYLTHRRSHWSFEADEALVDPADATGFGSVRVLVERFRDKSDLLAELRSDCETIIWWSGDSDSSQGGFVIPADLLRGLAELGCEFRGTAYVTDTSEDN